MGGTRTDENENENEKCKSVKAEVVDPHEKIEVSADEFFDGIAKVEKARQETNISQINANDRDNQRQYEYATGEAQRADKRWYVGLIVTSLLIFPLLILGIYLIVAGKEDIGFKIITHLATAVLGFIAGFGISKVGKK